ncbi:MAG: FAD:protein FMN transferase, partial [Deltaproteobacteria bacterium]|nr:FAD:protein FMN transferase [Deltaproteobacteria bacterium]
MRTVLLPVLALLAASCGSREKLEDVFYPMGGIPMRITAFDVTQSRFDALFEEVRGRVEDLEGELSMFIPDSDIAMLNTKGAGEVSEDTVAVVEQALRLCKNTGGAFDPTVGPLMELWHNAAATDRAPEPKDLAAALERVGCNKVETSRSRSRVHLGQAGMRLDLGGIAKGYAAGEAAAIMQAHGVTRGIVDLGGDVVLFSGKGDPPFRVGIKHP